MSPLSPDSLRKSPSPESIQSLEALGAEGLPGLLALLAEPRWATRRLVVRALADLGDLALPELMRELSEHRASETRIASAMDALATSRGDADTPLLAMAEHEDPAVAADAAQILGRRRSTRAVPMLCRLATGADGNVALAAIEALGNIGSPDAVETLLGTLATPDIFRSLPSIDALGRLGDSRAVEPLGKLLADPQLAAEAARALARTADPAAAPLLLRALRSAPVSLLRVLAVALEDLGRAVFETYGAKLDLAAERHDPEGLVAERLVAALKDADVAEQASLATLLGGFGDESASADLGRLLQSPAAATAAAAAAALAALGPRGQEVLSEQARIGDTGRRRLLLPLLTDSEVARGIARLCLSSRSPELRLEACLFFERTAAPGAARELVACVTDAQSDVAAAATAALQVVNDPTALPLLEAASEASPLATRAAIYRLLATLAAGEKLDVVLRATRDPDPAARLVAIRALAHADPAAAAPALVEALSADDPKARAAAARSVVARGLASSVLGHLVALTRDADVWVRYYAVQGLALAGEHAEASLALRAALDDPAELVQLAALTSITEHPTPTTQAALEAVLARESSPSSPVQTAALAALARLGHLPALGQLERALAEGDAPTKTALLPALVHVMDPPATGLLQRGALDDDETVRQIALETLGAREDDAALELLLALQDPRSRGVVHGILSTPSPGRVSTLGRALAAAPEGRSTRLAAALARIGTDAAREALIEALQRGTESARAAAAKALRIVGGPNAREALARAAATDESVRVRGAAALG